ncbi:MAG: hypothetical protein KDI65_12600 [Alphaproteobacteria bacterium]|nr:hypothetical protein [Alphaproteobacteria bacterium]
MEIGTLSVPWWASLYLVVLFSFTVAGIIEDWRRNPRGACASAISCCFSFVFVIGFFHPDWATKFGWVLIPMLIYGLMWEFYASVQESSEAEQELKSHDDLTEEEQTMLLNMAIIVNALVVVPGYMAGLKLCMDLFL